MTTRKQLQIDLLHDDLVAIAGSLRRFGTLSGHLAVDITGHSWLCSARSAAACDLLFSHGLDLHQGHQPLLLQLVFDDRSVSLDWLLTRGADPNLSFANGGTALHDAALHRRHASMAVLLKHGARPDIPDRAGQTALELVDASSLDVVLQMLRAIDAAALAACPIRKRLSIAKVAWEYDNVAIGQRLLELGDARVLRQMRPRHATVAAMDALLAAYEAQRKLRRLVSATPLSTMAPEQQSGIGVLDER